MPLPRPPLRARALWAAAALSATALLSAPLPAVAAGPTAAPTTTPDPALSRAFAKSDKASFFVVLKDRADLSGARGRSSHAARAGNAFEKLRATADTAQAPLRAWLDKRKVGHQDYWIANTVQVTGDKELAATLAARSDVARVVPDHHYALDDIETSDARVTSSRTDADTPEWGVADIGADKVWKRYEDRGEGIVIANVDSGVQYDHPDLVGSYRGNNGDGSFTHDYNWYDATGQCGTSGVPCDNNGHGTHTMGTMVGANGIGVAPGARWIAAKGCETSSCSDASLLKAGQWILAPTDHNGQNPRPDLAPDIVNNSWGGDDTTFYQDIVEAWNAAGIFEAFAAGNDGDGTTCSTAHAPGSQAPAYGIGAYDSGGRIASFSGFGPSLVDGSAKPDLAAPGVDVRSTWPGSAYNVESGTSMATPHVAGAVALLWSAAPSLAGDIDATRALLAEGARDVDDTHCGGTAARNNVWGEGKLDILASVDKAPHTAATLTGPVTAGTTGAPLGGGTVEATRDGHAVRSVTTGSEGTYRLSLAPGTYDLSLSGYGYASATATGLALGENQALGRDFALTAVAAHKITGTVRDVTGKPLAGAGVSLDGTPVPAVTTDARGTYELPAVAEGTYTLTVRPAAPVLCDGVSSGTVAVTAGLKRDVRLPARSDAFGNTCAPAAYSWIDGTKKVPLSGDEDATTIKLPFPVKLYGVPYSTTSVTTNGMLDFLAPRVGDYANVLDKKSSVKTATSGTKGARTFAVVWDNVAYATGTAGRATFEVVLDEASGAVTTQYRTVPDHGAGATVGLQDQTGGDALAYSFNQPVLTDGSAVRFTQGAKG
ncbi:S8 family serine peptidase [Streptomyces sp. NEAU-H3]|uniref:S8 family serine peptidase n=1 Tax=Streptomyces sp. NEAU-H3 TaxID=2720636 RepID=UPI00143BDDAB|nr:S8 family serine peptidase [Streptomyces sp. NEAU-H3]NJA56885.1 S8 family serine peptidase [Streptomyces sp. NEAU-H3]